MEADETLTRRTGRDFRKEENMPTLKQKEENMPTLQQIENTAAQLFSYVRRTPAIPWPGTVPKGISQIVLKLELFQYTGTFKARGALANMLALSPDALKRGVTAVSAGNHAVAVAWAASKMGTRAKVVMQSIADPMRVRLARDFGAEVILKPPSEAFAEAMRIEREEKMTFLHPFDGERTACGTGTLGLELVQQIPDLDAVVVSVGGGGLAGGLAAAIKAVHRNCEVLGVEPTGADAMLRSFQAGHAIELGGTSTVADSLAPPMVTPYSYQLCRTHLDDLVAIDDDLICAGLALLQQEAKIAVEPAGAAAIAAALGPYRARLAGKRVAVVICGANINPRSYADMLIRGLNSLERLENV
ncbi:threonine ammonia-lyase [Cupriavidus sp. D39]|uniref:threonine ammonia-lyase n=1 Tax=Cupriavidus sp. D39 TaxID=2997877 RepID=UPI00226FBA39|nr:pyridoxal-phosphate dependent enzyme [Cupriavidus sp. D39]MCY0855056.1 pyridoxal-phosphate dependent enzyme [Cupriavidus sp. D39]